MKNSFFIQTPQNYIVHYLQAGTLKHGILLRYNLLCTCTFFTDADWADDKNNYRSTTGYIVYLGTNPITWSLKLQSTLARSSTKAEFRAVASTTTEVYWLISLLFELGFQPSSIPNIYCDNLSATTYSANPIFHSWMKHPALDFRLNRISRDDQVALTSKIGHTNVSSIVRNHATYHAPFHML